ncbi:MAG: SDR family oxidoreductase [Desulfobacteraceae bacterium]|nr:SDR family oxidoreductase [Desulfobacteraceae bacterium]
MEEDAFKGKVALITGSSRGIGRAIALRFARAGADVVVNHSKAGGHSADKAAQVCSEVESLGRGALAVPADISLKSEVKEMFSKAAEHFGRLDYLVLNAARAPFKPAEKLLEREIRQLVDTNLIGNIFCVQQAVPLLEATSGKIVFISSLGSRFYLPSYPLGSMKAAMEALIRDCSESLGPKGISVNAVCSGIVKTDSFRVLRMYMKDIEHIPDDLCVSPEEVADVVLFLCSPAARAVCGETIVVDKGLSNRLYRPAWTAKP